MFKYVLHEAEKNLFSAMRKTQNEEKRLNIYAYRFNTSIIKYFQIKSTQNKIEIELLFFLLFITLYLLIIIIFYTNPYICLIVYFFPAITISLGYNWLSQFPRPQIDAKHRKKLNLENFCQYCYFKKLNPNQELDKLVIFYKNAIKITSGIVTLVFFPGFINALNSNDFFDSFFLGQFDRLSLLNRMGTISLVAILVFILVTALRFYAPLAWCKRMKHDLDKMVVAQI